MTKECEREKVNQAEREKIMPSQWSWHIINNLQKFNDKPDMILTLIKKMRKLEDHTFFGTQLPIYECIGNFWNQNSKFPDVNWLSLTFKDNITIISTADEFSMQVYESFNKYLEQELLRKKLEETVNGKDVFDPNEIRKLSQAMTSYSDQVTDEFWDSRESLVNSYDEYSKGFDGVKTYIKPVDNVIGLLGHKSLSVFAAPTGNGKSTLALSVAFYNALNGHMVNYVSFEISKEQVWFNLVSMWSEDKECRLPSSKIKESDLTDEEKELYKKYMNEMLDAFERSGGYIHILDQTTAAVSTYEGFCAKLESTAERLKRKADLIVVDNIDNFQIFRSEVRDEITRINNYIVALDAFCKTYANGAGTSILLLSQVNRVGLKKLTAAEGDGGRTATKVDVSCIQKFNALYEKPTCVLIGYADEVLRANSEMKLYVAKLRNKGVPTEPIVVHVNFAFSKVKGEIPVNSYESQEDIAERAKDFIDSQRANFIYDTDDGSSFDEDFIEQMDEINEDLNDNY